MKTLFFMICAGGIVGAPLVSLAQTSAQPDKTLALFGNRISDSTRDDETLASQDRAAIAQVRASEMTMMEGVHFSEECTTVSEPLNRLKFQHERNVNSFLAIPMKLGMSRALIVHMSNPRLATHGGVVNSSFQDDDAWNENGSCYSLSRPWGMIGNLDQKEPKAYLFRPSPILRRPAKEDQPTKAVPGIEVYPVNRFEAYALTMLRKGEQLVRWERKDTMYAVGAIRAEAQCLRCHDGASGDLLGAFTYSYAKTNASMPDEKTKLMLKFNDDGKTLAQIADAAGLLKEVINPTDTRAIANASYYVTRALLEQGIVTDEMHAELDRWRKQLLDTDLGPVKKPHASADAE